MNKGMSKKFSRTYAIIHIKYVLPRLCHLSQYSHGSQDPTTRIIGFASYQGLWIMDPFSYWHRWHNMATHTLSVQQAHDVPFTCGMCHVRQCHMWTLNADLCACKIWIYWFPNHSGAKWVLQYWWLNGFSQTEWNMSRDLLAMHF